MDKTALLSMVSTRGVIDVDQHKGVARREGPRGQALWWGSGAAHARRGEPRGQALWCGSGAAYARRGEPRREAIFWGI